MTGHLVMDTTIIDADLSLAPTTSDDAYVEGDTPENNSPVLPPELERSIFEFVAFNVKAGTPEAAKLLLVAKAVQSWVKPLLYQYLHIDGDSDTTTPRVNITAHHADNANGTAPKIEAIGPFVRHLLITGEFHKMLDIVTHCPGLISFSMWFSAVEVDWTMPTPPSLTGLSVSFEQLPKDQILQRNIFHHITHLDLIHPPSKEQWDAIQELPHLTHLASEHIDGMDDEEKIVKILGACRKLRLLVLLIAESELLDKIPSNLVKNDGRLVLGYRSEVWPVDTHVIAWSQDGLDFWTYYERFKTARERGYLLPSVSHLFPIPLRSRWTNRFVHQSRDWDEYLTEEGRVWFRCLSW